MTDDWAGDDSDFGTGALGAFGPGHWEQNGIYNDHLPYSFDPGPVLPHASC